jgi:predicted metal-binding membrane protein
VEATTFASRPLGVDPLRRLIWRRPEWPWALLVGSAWIVLVAERAWPAAHPPLAGPEMQHPMGPAMSMGSPTSAPHSHHHHDLSPSGLGWWMLMTIAMMVPAALPVLREISFQSVWARRYRSSAIFLTGYLAVWGMFGAATVGTWAVVITPSPLPATILTGGALLGAAVWGLTGAKCRYLKRCHRYLPLAARGRAADQACLRFGLYHAQQCVGVCWPLMLAMVYSHALVMMLGVTALVTWERLARLPRLRMGALLLATVGTISLLVS